MTIVLHPSSLILLCASCSTQVITRPNGDRLVNNNFFSAGTIYDPDTKLLMSGTSEKAAEHIGDYARALLMYGALKHGVNAAVDMVDDATK